MSVVALRGRRLSASRVAGLPLRGGVALAVSAALLGAFLVAAAVPASAATLFKVSASIAVGGNPIAVAVDPSTHNVYAVNDVGKAVSVIDESGGDHTGTVVATIAVGPSPLAVAVDPTTHNVYVANYASNTVSVIDESGDIHTGTVVATIPVTVYPYAVAVDPTTHNVYVISRWSNTVSVIDESGDAHSGTVVATIRVTGDPDNSELGGVAVDPATHRVYVTNSANNTVSVIDESGDAHTGTVVGTIAVGEGPAGVTVDPATHNVYVPNSGSSTVSVIDESGDAHTGTVVATIAVGANPFGVALDPTTHNIYVPNSGSSTVSVITAVAAGMLSGEVTDASGDAGIPGACVQVVTAATGHQITLLHANNDGDYSGLVPVGTDKLIASDCVGATHATTYYGGADNYDFLGADATPVDVTATSDLTGLKIALPLAGTISGTVTDSATRHGISGICAYAIDTTVNELRAYSAPSTASGGYTINLLPPGTDRVAFQPCTTGPYPLTYSSAVRVIAGATVTVNEALTSP